jgi:protein-tyrosine phosphatase
MEIDEQNRNTRIIPLPGLYNVRDLGGYAVRGGTVKWGLLYRAGDFPGLLPEAKAELEARDIRTIVDFRDQEERDLNPDSSLATVRETCALSLRTGAIVDFFGAKTVAEAEANMETLYRRLPAAGIDQYRTLFALLADREKVPLLFHCSAGKDRTGLAAALILAALGAARETIIEDYCLSAPCLAGKYDAIIARYPAAEPYMTVRRNFIMSALHVIDTGMGGMERYLVETLGAAPAVLRELYVEPDTNRKTVSAPFDTGSGG